MAQISPEAQGYDCEFVNKPSKVQTECPICLLILRKPTQLDCCGYDYCRSCIRKALRDQNACPMCKKQNPTSFPDKNMERSLSEYRVFCVHRAKQAKGDKGEGGEGRRKRIKPRRGCEWEGKLEGMEEHLKECAYAPVVCDFLLVGCQEQLPRAQMKSHIRKNSVHHTQMFADYAKEHSDDRLKQYLPMLVSSVNTLSELVENDTLVAQYREEISTLTTQNEAQKKKMSSLTSQNESQRREMEARRQEMEARRQEISTLTTQNEVQKKKISTLTTQNEVQKKKISTLITEKEAQKKKISTLTAQSEAQKKKISTLTTQNESQGEKNSALTEQNEAQREEISTLTEQNRFISGMLWYFLTGGKACKCIISLCQWYCAFSIFLSIVLAVISVIVGLYEKMLDNIHK